MVLKEFTVKISSLLFNCTTLMTDENNYKIKMFYYYYYYCGVGDTHFIMSDRTFCYTVLCDIVPDRGIEKPRFVG